MAFQDTRGRWRGRLCLCLTALLGGAACGGGTDAPPLDSGSEASLASVRSPVDRFRVRLAVASGDDAPFSMITGLDVDSHGRIYVADWLQSEVSVLDPDGRLVSGVGRAGAGPGEFRRVSAVQVLAGDSLLVFDRGLQRVTVFPPGSPEPARTIALAGTRSGSLPVSVHRAGGEGLLLARYSSPYVAGEGADDRPPDVLALLSSEGFVEHDALLRLPSAEQLVVQSGGRLSVGPHPFGREAIVRVMPDGRVAYAWTGSVAFRIIDLDGRTVLEYAEPFERLPVTPAQLERLEREVPEHAADALREWEPRTWPALAGMLVDDQGRVWLGVRTREGERNEWAAYTGTGEYLGSFHLPEDVELHAIRGGRAYGVRIDELDVPTIVIYEIQREPSPVAQP